MNLPRSILQVFFWVTKPHQTFRLNSRSIVPKSTAMCGQFCIDLLLTTCDGSKGNTSPRHSRSLHHGIRNCMMIICDQSGVTRLAAPGCTLLGCSTQTWSHTHALPSSIKSPRECRPMRRLYCVKWPIRGKCHLSATKRVTRPATFQKPRRFQRLLLQAYTQLFQHKLPSINLCGSVVKSLLSQ